MSGEGNALHEILNRAEWKPRQLAHAVNARLDRRGLDRHRIHLSTPYHWLKHGYCPYEPVPEIVAELLAERLGQRVTVDMLWPGKAEPRAAALSAHDGLEARWSGGGTLRLLDDLVAMGDVERRCYQPVTGTPLITVALDGMVHETSPVTAALGAERVLPPMMDLLDGHIAALRRLDDRQGGGALSLRYVTNELQGVLDLVRCSSYSAEIGKRLYTSVANLAQLAGWMHFDAGETGSAQRYFLLGLRAARAAEDQACAANILGMLAYQSAHSAQPAEAVRLAEAAGDAASQLDLVTQARIAGRLATAQAAAGDVYAFRAASERARDLLENGQPEDGPEFLYYFNAEQLAAESGQALVELASQLPDRRLELLAEAAELLAPLSSVGPREDYQRSALLHGCYLTEAHLLRGDLQSACAALRTALPRIAGVHSGRCSTLLRKIRRSLLQRKRSKYVATVLPELDRAL
jgi:hypothetical protein